MNRLSIGLRRGLALGLAVVAPAWLLSETGMAWALGSGATTVVEVAVLSPPAADGLLGEAVSRLRSELGAMGLSSHLVSCTDDVAVDARACEESRAALRAANTRPGSGPVSGTSRGLGSAAVPPPRAPAALVSLAREDGVVTIEVIEHLPNGSKFFRLVYVPVRDGGKDPAVLAIRGVELLRDLHMDVERGAATPVAPPRLESPRAAPIPELERDERRPTAREDLEPERYPPGPPPERGPWQIGLALTALQGTRGLGPSVGGALEGAFAVTTKVSTFALVSGPFFGDLSGQVGTVTVRQELALAGVRLGLPFARVRPHGAVALGILHVRAQGTSTSLAGAATMASSLWAPTLAVGAGATVKVSRLVDLGAEVDLLWAAPAAEITIDSEVAGRAGAPSFLAQVGVWLALP